MKRVAIIPGSFRPPTDGHFKMIRHYSGSCDAVAVIISNPEKDLRETSTGVPISPETSKRIIETALGDAEIGNVKVFIAEGSPVKEIWNILGNLGDREVVLGMGTKDDADGRFGRIVDEFRGKRGLEIVGEIPRSDEITRFEDLGMTTVEGDPTLPVSRTFIELAQKLM